MGIADELRFPLNRLTVGHPCSLYNSISVSVKSEIFHRGARIGFHRNFAHAFARVESFIRCFIFRLCILCQRPVISSVNFSPFHGTLSSNRDGRVACAVPSRLLIRPNYRNVDNYFTSDFCTILYTTGRFSGRVKISATATNHAFIMPRLPTIELVQIVYDMHATRGQNRSAK